MGFLLFVLAFTKLFPTVRDSTEWTSGNQVDLSYAFVIKFMVQEYDVFCMTVFLYDNCKYVRCFWFSACHTFNHIAIHNNII